MNMCCSLCWGQFFWFDWRSCGGHFHVFHITKWQQIICIFSTIQKHKCSQSRCICSGVAFESQKMPVASRVAKLLFLLLLEHNLTSDSFPYLNIACIASHSPNACIKVKYFWIPPKVLPICPIHGPKLCIFEYPHSSFWFVPSCCSTYKSALLEDLCQLLSNKRFLLHTQNIRK